MITKMRRLMRPLRFDCGSERGFSILENMISMAIFSVGILSISMLFTQTMTFTHNSEKMSVATNLAKGKLEELRNTPYANIVPGTDSETVDNVKFDLEWTVTNDSPVKGVRKVVMEISWTDLRKDHTIEFETLFSRF
ncbi:MAG: prepilin-type N-terminal cleavage/methylation domain-containing protein [Deltaproteobacteria bacterium]|uniref:Prepilin-type N-terminal cleavage/methylation domain-containing protein n=1 Tax=Candidatus Zymogenus saltonus TaxID=2844893 RepID=A0A9D8KBQ0_9DELT|nr:prepilin-type N-terminal cleavage/methylation domain-containing protein [Candidatus Zymogenus saltonus]